MTPRRFILLTLTCFALVTMFCAGASSAKASPRPRVCVATVNEQTDIAHWHIVAAGAVVNVSGFSSNGQIRGSLPVMLGRRIAQDFRYRFARDLPLTTIHFTYQCLPS